MQNEPPIQIRPNKPQIDLFTILQAIQKSPQRFIGAIAVLLFIIASFSSFFSIDTDQQGIILRLGKYDRIVGPGLHFKLPFGIEKVDKVATARVYKAEFGFRTLKAGVSTRFAERGFEEESIMLTGDLNVADVKWIVQFRISEPLKFLYRVRSPEKNIRDISEASMRLIVGDRSVSDVLTTGRAAIALAATETMQQLANDYDLGVKIVTVQLQNVNPPDPVKPSFNRVNEAKQEQEKLINEAWEAYNKVIPKAKGEALQLISDAEGYAVDRVNRAKGDTERFAAFYKEYKKSPQVTRDRLYLETMSEVLTKPEKLYVIDPEQKSLLNHLQFGQKGSAGGAK